MIRVVLPFHLQTLARVDGEVAIEVEAPATLGSILDALESRYPVLSGTIRDHVTKKRRPFLRFYACQRDFSNEPAETRLPEAVVSGKEPLLIIGAIAGG
jgi:molybdopterin synthase sulfur carrier subunit